jgi:hypothetical protein
VNKKRKRKEEKKSDSDKWKWKMVIKEVLRIAPGNTLSIKSTCKAVIKRFKVFRDSKHGGAVAEVAKLSKSDLKSFVKSKIQSCSFTKEKDGEVTLVKQEEKEKKKKKKKK